MIPNDLGWYDPKEKLPDSDDPVIADIAEIDGPVILICWIGDYIDGKRELGRERAWVLPPSYSDLPSHFTVARWCYFDFDEGDFKRNSQF